MMESTRLTSELVTCSHALLLQFEVALELLLCTVSLLILQHL